ncbi:hypothetical protein Q5752_002812 [Cryptotrichosporon argae]
MTVDLSAPLTATIQFTLPASRLDHDEDIYLTYVADRSRPTEAVVVPVADLRPDLDDAGPVKAQLDVRGFAVARHTSAHVDRIGTKEGIAAYLDETAALLREAIGCSRVIAWNSVVRQNSADVTTKTVERQKAPEDGFVPASRKQPVAAVAHVDQDETWGLDLAGRAMGGDAATAAGARRCQIVNMWRPLHGPVTNAPLAMCDYRSLAPPDVSKHASMFGIGMDIHHAPAQKWGYVRHQTPGEVVWLKCFDSAQGADGSAKYCGHVAVQVDGDEDGVPEELRRPRESVEVRCVAVWE